MGQIALMTLAAAFTSGFVPLLNLEAYLLATAALLPDASLLVLVVPAAIGQMGAKAILYLGGRGLVALPGRHRARALAAASRVASERGCAPGVVFASALLGLPPFYLVSVAAGLVRVPARGFLLTGLAGRFLRFAAVFGVARVLGLAS